MKPEAALQSSLIDGQVQNPTPHVPSSSHNVKELPSNTIDGVLRVNDMYAEWDSMDTVNAVKTALEERYSVDMIEADEQAYQRLLHAQPDFVFNIAEGLHGASREAQIPAMLEMLHIPYLGSDPLTLGLCLDKPAQKRSSPTIAFRLHRLQLSAPWKSSKMRA